MKKLIGLIVAPLLCVAGTYFMFLVAGTAIIADSMPVGVQDEAWGWIQGTPQAVASDPGLPGESTYSTGSFYWAPEGYIGQASFVCMLTVEGPARVSSCYGDTEGRAGLTHSGIDFATNHEQGRQVWTPFGGMITFAGWNYYLGWTVVVENDGWQVILGHLCCGGKGSSSSPSGSSSLLVTEGAVLRAGDLVGLSGETGNSTGPHLHFEMRHCDDDGRCHARNPEAVLLPGQAGPCAWQTLGDLAPAACRH